MRLPAALALLLLASPVSAKPASPTIVTIADGTLRGDQVEGIVSFKGIPFAKPPVGPLRWRAPQPASRWNGERDATRYSHDCMQKPFNGDAAPLGTPPAEDCLYANVWKPAGAAEKLPVMVWIYGGGFLNGGASPAVYSGAPLARQGIMVVSFNYRLGRLGTFAHPQLTKADPDRGQLANYGYMDQVAALRWIKRNIAAFGGDPGNITIVGESAGGMSAHTLVTSPQTRGLFQRAVMLSGGPHEAATFASAEATGLAFAQSKGIAPDDPQALDRLRALSAADVAGDINMIALFSPPRGPKTFSSPVIDGRIAVDPMTAYRANRFPRMPIMLGATSDDTGGPDGMMIGGARRAAALLAEKGVPAYYYRFSYVADADRTPRTKGALHASDIPFFFDTAAIKYGARTTPADRAAARLASGYLVNFVKSGNPNGGDLPFWPRYVAPQGKWMDLDGTGRAASADVKGP